MASFERFISLSEVRNLLSTDTEYRKYGGTERIVFTISDDTMLDLVNQVDRVEK